MVKKNSNSSVTQSRRPDRPSSSRGSRRRRRVAWLLCTAGLAVILIGAVTWVAFKAATVKTELQSAMSLLPDLKHQIAANDADGAADTVGRLTRHTGLARDAVNDPLWKAASLVPWMGPNLQAGSEMATSADDVARLGATPLVNAFQSLNWETLSPGPGTMNLASIQAAAPSVKAASHAVKESSRRLQAIDSGQLLPQVSGPLREAIGKLSDLNGDLETAADAATLAPSMLGVDTPRRYLLLMQNNAESRATGGIPGALAVLSVDKGNLTLESQTSATSLGAFMPPMPMDAEQKSIYTARVGKFMQDVNLTPDFATTAKTANAMWEKSKGERLDGVISVDAVALSFVLEATGPVEIKDPTIQQIGSKLPAQLTEKNVVQTLLSDTYAKITEPKLQDIYFAGAAKEIFGAVASGNTDSKKLIAALSRGVEERRILLWSGSSAEQSVIGTYPIGGMISGTAISPAQFGVYFNDGTGAKMDYWIKRSVQIVKDCTRDGYREVSVRVTSTNTAPSDAAVSLPRYVTGDGEFGIPPGSVQTNIVAYGPVQSNIDTVVKDGGKIPFAAQRHSQRAVGTSTIQLAPGESTVLDFNFGHIVQHADPKLVVTPTTQAVKDVLQTSSSSPCE